MSKTAREKITQVCVELNLKIIELIYDPSITYVSGGWGITVKPEGFDEEVYGAHCADELIDELRREFT